MRPILMAAMVGNLDIVKMLINSGCNCQVVNKVNMWLHIWNTIFDSRTLPVLLLNTETIYSLALCHQARSNRDCHISSEQCSQLGHKRRKRFVSNRVCQSAVVQMVNTNRFIQTDDGVHQQQPRNRRQTHCCWSGCKHQRQGSANWILEVFKIYWFRLYSLQQGRLASHWASFKGHDKVLLSLLKAGINADEKDGDDKTGNHLDALVSLQLIVFLWSSVALVCWIWLQTDFQMFDWTKLWYSFRWREWQNCFDDSCRTWILGGCANAHSTQCQLE